MRRNPAARLACIAAVLIVLAACAGAPPGVQPVAGFEVERYMGTWFEVARLPNRFERGLEHITATYSLAQDGTVRVVNRGYDAASGEWREAVGRARFRGDPDVAALEVSFFGPFYGGYNVVELDPEYGYALVAGPTRGYLWVLARQPTLPEPVLQRLAGRAASLGFDVSELLYVRH